MSCVLGQINLDRLLTFWLRMLLSRREARPSFCPDGTVRSDPVSTCSVV